MNIIADIQEILISHVKPSAIQSVGYQRVEVLKLLPVDVPDLKNKSLEKLQYNPGALRGGEKYCILSGVILEKFLFPGTLGFSANPSL